MLSSVHAEPFRVHAGGFRVHAKRSAVHAEPSRVHAALSDVHAEPFGVHAGGSGVPAALFNGLAFLFCMVAALCGLGAELPGQGAATFAHDAPRHVAITGGGIVGLCDINGSGGTARVVGEWVYDAYGEPIFAANAHPHAVLKCGHKGLFFDRLDAGVYDPATGGEMERLVADCRGLYYARNRHHKPDWGRWLRADRP